MRVMLTEQGKEVVMFQDGDMERCPRCGVVAVVPLTPKQLAAQPDDTTLVCHPALGGCNQGYARERKHGC